MCISTIKIEPVEPVGSDEPRLQMRAVKRLDGSLIFASVSFKPDGSLQDVDAFFNGFQPKGQDLTDLFVSGVNQMSAAMDKGVLVEVE
jgi:hypothetical protein